MKVPGRNSTSPLDSTPGFVADGPTDAERGRTVQLKRDNAYAIKVHEIAAAAARKSEKETKKAHTDTKKALCACEKASVKAATAAEKRAKADEKASCIVVFNQTSLTVLIDNRIVAE